MTWSEGVAKRLLANGLTLLVQRDSSAPVVAAVTHVKAGYFDEPDEWVGIAHVLEHMFFKGTARRGPGQIARATQMVGGYLNAGTIYDQTVYYTVLPSTHGGLEQALDVQADALMHSALDADELARELEVIIQEAKRKLDTPNAVTTETLYQLLFRVHRMRRWRIGTEDGLRRLTADDVRRYYETRYTPDRVIVGIVGDVDVERVLDLATRTYEPWSRPAASVEQSPVEPDGSVAAARTLRGDVKRPLASLGWRTEGTLHADVPALDVAATVLGGGRGSQLYRALRVPGIAASAHASHYTPTEVGVFEIALEADPERLDRAVEVAWQLVASLGEDGPSDQEIERARALIETSYARRHESMDGRAAALCAAEALGNYELVDELFERIHAVEARDVARAVRTYAAPDRVSCVVYVPDGVTTRVETDWPPAIAGVTEVPSAGTEIRGAVVLTAATRADERRVRSGGVVEWTFPGVDVLVRPKRGSGVVTLLLHLPGVPTSETAENAGISWLWARAALRGAGGMDGDELARSTEILGGSASPQVGVESLGWGLTVRPAGLEHAAAVLRALALEPRLSAADVRVERELQASDAAHMRDNMFHYPIQRVLGQAFPGHAYGFPSLGEPETLLTITHDGVRAWAQSALAARPVVLVVGDCSAEEAVGRLAPLTSWPAHPPIRPSANPPSWTPGSAAESRQKQQTALAMAFPCAAFGSADRFPLTVVGAVLSGLAGRLFDELREKRSLAYTVAAFPWLVRRAGAVLGYIATSPGREEEARSAMLTELARLINEPPTAEELDRARNYAAGSVELRQQTGRAVAGEILEAWVHGSLDSVAETADRLRTVTRDDVARIAADVFDAERRAEYVVQGG